MKISHIILIYFVIVASVFSQSPKYDLVVFTNSDSMQVDRIKTTVPISALVNIDRFDKVISTGARWGGYGIGVGIVSSLIYSTTTKYSCNMECAAITALSVSVGILSGLVYGGFSEISKNYNVGNFNFGLEFSFGQSMAAESFRYIGNFGVVFRDPNFSYYKPDNYTFYFGEEEVSQFFDDASSSKLHLTKYGIKIKNIGYQKTLSFIYGIDFGYSTGEYASFTEDIWDEFEGWKKTSTMFFDIIIGANFNLTKNIHGSIEYQYGLYGAHTRKSMTPIFDNPAHGLTSFSIYTFLW